MTKNTIILGALVIVGLGAALFYFTPTSSQGRVIVGITDDATSLEGVSSIMMTVDKVEVQNDTQGWVTVSGVSKQYDLIQLKQSGAIALFADVNIPTGTYDQIRLVISKVEVTASGKTEEAKLPSGMLKIVGRLVVEEGKTATVVLDFIADKSLHMTGNGKFILAPVVKIQTKSDVLVEVQSDDTVKINGGKDEDEANFGMDERGETKKDFELGPHMKIELDNDGMIHIMGKDDDDDGDDHMEDVRSEGEVKLNLSTQNNSGIAGTVNLEGEDGKVEAKLELMGVPTGVLGLLGISVGATHPAHVHLGSCASIGAVKYPLASTVNGKSETMINVSLATLKAQLPLAINVHKSSEESDVYVACTDIKL